MQTDLGIIQTFQTEERCPGGEIGRRVGLKIQFQQWSISSILILGIHHFICRGMEQYGSSSGS